MTLHSSRTYFLLDLNWPMNQAFEFLRETTFTEKFQFAMQNFIHLQKSIITSLKISPFKQFLVTFYNFQSKSTLSCLLLHT